MHFYGEHHGADIFAAAHFKGPWFDSELGFLAVPSVTWSLILYVGFLLPPKIMPVGGLALLNYP